MGSAASARARGWACKCILFILGKGLVVASRLDLVEAHHSPEKSRIGRQVRAEYNSMYDGESIRGKAGAR
jgi:hypothetical protein